MWLLFEGATRSPGRQSLARHVHAMAYLVQGPLTTEFKFGRINCMERTIGKCYSSMIIMKFAGKLANLDEV